MDPYRPDPEIEKILKLVLPSINKGLQNSLEYMMRTFSYYVTFQDFANMLMIKLEENIKLNQDIKEKLIIELENIYNKSAKETVLEISNISPDKFIDFIESDYRSIEYALKLHDFYLGKFFQEDKELRKRVVNWLTQYYLQEGNPIGRGQEGVKEFLKQFERYIQPQTEWKARQIIDTSVNFLRNSGRIKTLQKARIENYRWDATNDRLTCKICRSYDGRVFKTSDAVRVLNMLETTQDPELIRELKPFSNELAKGPSNSLPTKMPPLHPHCRCRVVAQIEEKELPIIVEPVGKNTPEQRELLKEYQSLTKAEIINRIRAHLGSEWARPPVQAKDKDVRKYLGQFLQKHYLAHAREVEASSLQDYKNLAYEIIRNPEKVFVERRVGQDYFLFYRDSIKVVCSDANMSINSIYKEEVEKWIERIQANLQSAIIRIM